MCKDVRMNARTSVCCRGVVFTRKNRHQIFSCCHGIGYDSAIYTCCGRSLVTRCATRSGIYTDHCSQWYADRPASTATTKCCTVPQLPNLWNEKKGVWSTEKQVGTVKPSSRGIVQCCRVEESCCGNKGLLTAEDRERWSVAKDSEWADCCSPALSGYLKASCCAWTAEKLGALPKCCNKVRPYCCGKGESMQCCARKPKRTCCLNKVTRRPSNTYRKVYSGTSRRRTNTRSTKSYLRRSSTSSSYSERPYTSISSSSNASVHNRRPSSSVTSTYTSYKRRPSFTRRRLYPTSDSTTKYRSKFYGGYARRRSTILNRGTGTSMNRGEKSTTVIPTRAKTHATSPRARSYATPKTTTLVIDKKNIRFDYYFVN